MSFAKPSKSVKILIMKKINFLIATITFSVMCANVNAQLDRLNRAVQRGAERALEKKAEEKAEEVVSKEIDKGFEKAETERAKGEAEAEKALNKAAEAIEEAEKNQAEAEAQVSDIPEAIPTVSNTPYTPSESEYVFFSMKKGAVQMFVSKDAKGKITSQSRTKIKEITGDKNAFAILYESESLDEKGNSLDKDNPLILNFRVVVKDGLMYLDMRGMFGAMEGMEGSEGMQVSGSAIKIPGNLSVGQKIDDAKASVKIGVFNCVMIMTEGKCLAIEDVKVEAGTFRCYKVSQKTNSTVLGIKSECTNVTWYAKGVGAVKTESYDKNGKLLSTQELKSNS